MSELQVETLDPLGLVAGVIDELGLVELTDGVLEFSDVPNVLL
ncbi:hypothetical protein C1752_10207 [Acaryochloris thomasi RCC1774]|uniref:DUF4277 domain-containing protein n=1 Tax=Acaryochloris thomasi RCC1774 TaxID=1764569 RepID=A0A2W1JHU6_9CYAN|nr:hypothetical protein C1752_10207 [Acaryochloris thomasi RCC1774]